MTKIFNYDCTSQLYNSNSTVAKIAKYSLVGIGLVAIVETIKNVVLSPFNLIANYNNSSSLISEATTKTDKQQNKNWKKTALKVTVLLSIVTGLSYLFYIRFSAPRFSGAEQVISTCPDITNYIQERTCNNQTPSLLNLCTEAKKCLIEKVPYGYKWPHADCNSEKEIIHATISRINDASKNNLDSIITVAKEVGSLCR